LASDEAKAAREDERGFVCRENAVVCRDHHELKIKARCWVVSEATREEEAVVKGQLTDRWRG
jgi:hypothetical protein